MQGLYLVTDRDLCGDKPLEEVVLQAVRGGVACVQLREKNVSTRFFIHEAARIKSRLAPFNVPLIINDRIDVALAAGADGVHVGQGSGCFWPLSGKRPDPGLRPFCPEWENHGPEALSTFENRW